MVGSDARHGTRASSTATRSTASIDRLATLVIVLLLGGSSVACDTGAEADDAAMNPSGADGPEARTTGADSPPAGAGLASGAGGAIGDGSSASGDADGDDNANNANTGGSPGTDGNPDTGGGGAPSDGGDESMDAGGIETIEPCVTGCPELEWVALAAGSFLMGREEGVGTPQRTVNVSGFELTRSEVTTAQYAPCVEAGVCQPPVPNTQVNWTETGPMPGRENHPANGLDWYMARTFCAWVGGRLPSEAEWEYAATSEGQSILYPWGDELPTCEHAVMREDAVNGCGANTTGDVCSKPGGLSAQGLCDLAGNVYEWVEDDYHRFYQDGPADGSAWVDTPRAPFRVTRSAPFAAGQAQSHEARERNERTPDAGNSDHGVRCAR